MDCANCGEAINPSDTRYEQVVPIQNGEGQTADSYCSIACLNEDVGFSEEEIESLMVEGNYEVPTEHEIDWYGVPEPDIHDLSRDPRPQGPFFYLFSHAEKDYDIVIQWEPADELFAVRINEYHVEDGQKMGYTTIEEEQTGVHQRAMVHARRMMEKVENGEV